MIVQLRAQLLAFSLSLRKSSNTLPWYWFVPDLITTLMMPPWKFPNSAEALFVMSLNSSIASRSADRRSGYRRPEVVIDAVQQEVVGLLRGCRLRTGGRRQPPRTPLLKLAGSGVTTPGASRVSATGLRLISGMFSIVCAPMVDPTCVVSVCKRGGAAVDGDALGDRADLHHDIDAAALVQLEREAAVDECLEAGCFDSEAIAPGRNARERVDSVRLVLVGHSVPRSRSFAITLALAMAAPEGSVTRPVIPALTSCAASGTLVLSSRNDATEIWVRQLTRR